MTHDSAEQSVSIESIEAPKLERVKRAAARPLGHTERMLGFTAAQGRRAPTLEQAPSRQINDPFRQAYREGNAIEPLYDPDKLLQLSEQNAIHAACISARAEDAVGRGWQLRATGRQVDQSLQVEVSDKLEELTPDISFSELIFAAVLEETAIGWAVWEFTRSEDRKISAIYPLPAHTLRATLDRDVFMQLRPGDTQRRYFKRFGCEREIDFTTGKEDQGTDNPATEVLVFRSYNPRSPWYGVPRWISAVPAIAELAAIREYNVSFFSSGGMADRLILTKAKTEKPAQKVSDQIKQSFTQAKGRGHTSVFAHGTEDIDVSVEFLTPNAGTRDGQYREQRREVIQEILMAHGTPPYRIGWAIMGSLGGSAAKEMLQAYHLGRIEPAQVILEDRLNKTLFGPDGIDLKGHRWELLDLDVSQLELDLRQAHEGVTDGYLTPNEARAVVGYPRVDEPALNTFYMGDKRVAIGQEPQGDTATVLPVPAVDGGKPDDGAADQLVPIEPAPDAGGGGAAVHPLFAGRSGTGGGAPRLGASNSTSDQSRVLVGTGRTPAPIFGGDR